jgi:hypothetical protein
MNAWPQAAGRVNELQDPEFEALTHLTKIEGFEVLISTRLSLRLSAF